MLRPLTDEEKAENWRACRRYLRRLLLLPLLIAVAFVWLAGYGQGLMEGAALCARPVRPPIKRKEPEMTSQFRMIDSAAPQKLRISWAMETPRDMDGTPPDERDDGFWPSRDPDAPGYVLPENYDSEMRKADRWRYVGVVAKARIFIPAGGRSFRVLEMESAGLWGIESNAGKYLREVYQEQKADLMKELAALGEALATGAFDEEDAE